MNKKPKAALAIFNSISKYSDEFWGNHHVSLLSGELGREGVENDVYLLLMQVGDAEQNRKTVDEFVGLVARGGYDVVYFETLWMPAIREKLEKEAPAAAIVCRGEAPEAFPRISPKLEAARARAENPWSVPGMELRPNFNFIRLGTSRKVEQKVVDMIGFLPCPYNDSLEKNPFYKKLPVKMRRELVGCSYCKVTAAKSGISAEDSNRIFLDQTRYYLEQIPGLDKISLPTPENFFGQLIELAPRLTSGDIRPVKFYMQLRPDVIVNRSKDMRAILEAFEGTGFGICLATVGLENFSARELQVLNRGYAPEMLPRALAIIKELKEKFPAELDMSRAIASFILFNPYTRVEDIALNVEKIAATDLSAFKSININKARIHPGAGLYELAEMDGLLVEEGGGTRLSDLPRGGYQGDYGYRFQDPRVERIYSSFAEAEKELSVEFEKHKIYILKRLVEYVK